MHHYYYKPSKPAANLYLQKLFDERSYQDHINAVTKIKASTKVPSFADKPNSFKYLRPLRKSSNTARSQSDTSRFQNNASQLSNQSQNSVSRTPSYAQLDTSSIYHQSSITLQKDPKTKPISTIEENALMYKRIMNVKPVLSREKMERDWKKSRHYKSIATHYPDNWKEFADKEDKVKQLSMSLIKPSSSSTLPPIKGSIKH